MVQHSRDTLANLGGDTSPRRTRSKFEWLGRIFAERRREQLQRLDVGVIHHLIFLSAKNQGNNRYSGQHRPPRQ